MRRILIAGVAAAAIALAGWSGAGALQSNASEQAVPAAPVAKKTVPPASPKSAAPAPVAKDPGNTPMAERTATIGLLNKRSGRVARSVVEARRVDPRG